MAVRRYSVIVYTFAILVSLCACLMAAYQLTPKQITIRRTDSGFVPETVLVRKHDVVRFVNDTKKTVSIVPAKYVSAELYPEARTASSIRPHESWAYRFEEAGVWSYKDGSDASGKARGEVLINGKPGESSKNCIAKAGVNLSAYCWAPEIRAILDSKGLEAAFRFFSNTYRADPVFQANCHDVTHILGVAAYEEFRGTLQVVSRPETSFCGFGFYHGFIQASLSGEGDNGRTTIRSYCEHLEESTSFSSPSAAHLAASACYHGIGHSLFDLVGEATPGDKDQIVRESLQECESLLDGEHARLMCSTGVYNSLANALSARAFGLSFADTDLLSACRTPKEAYREQCYAEVGLGYVREKALPSAEGFAYFNTFDYASGTAKAIVGLVDDDIRRSIVPFDGASYRLLCSSFKERQNQNACITGVSVGLSFEAQITRDYSRMLSFCEAIPIHEPLRDVCFGQMAARIRGMAAEREVLDICRKLAADDKKAAACPFAEGRSGK